jgi:hypothetical protein
MNLRIPARRKAPVTNTGSSRAAAAHRTRPGAVWRDRLRGFDDVERPSTPQMSPLRTGGTLQRHASCPCGGSCPRCRQHAAQSGLRMSEPGDPFERQADRVAERIMQASPAVARRPDAATPTLPQPGRVDSSSAQTAGAKRTAPTSGGGFKGHTTSIGGYGGKGRDVAVHQRTPHPRVPQAHTENPFVAALLEL